MEGDVFEPEEPRVSEETYTGRGTPLKDSFLTIDRWLEENRPSRFSLNPPISDSEIDQMEAEFGYKIPDSLRFVYRWHNGGSGGGTFFCEDKFLPLDKAVKESASAWKLAKQLSDRLMISPPEFFWKREWLPVTYFEGWGLLVPCSDVPSDDSHVLFYCNEEPSRRIAFRSVPEMFEFIARGIEQGLYSVSPEGDVVDSFEDLERLRRGE